MFNEFDLRSYFAPNTWTGALIYLVVFLTVAVILSRGLRTLVQTGLARHSHLDRTTTNFLQQFGSALIWVIALIFYAQLIPALRAVGTALLAGASIASVVIGLAAQSTLGNLVAGVSITIYKPFRLGDTLQVATPTGTEVGVIEQISLGYTTLRTQDMRRVVLPNALAASQVTLNLTQLSVQHPLVISLSVPRQSGIEEARTLAIDTALAVDSTSKVTCFLVKIEGTAAVLEVRIDPGSVADRDNLRSALLSKLADTFSGWGPATEGLPRLA